MRQLEHLEWPRESVLEMFRVLKPGGKIFITVPMAQGEHQVPYDFFRYTSYGLKSILTHTGFSDVEIKPCGGFFTRWAYELPKIISIFPSTGLRKRDYNLLGIILLPFKISLIPIVRSIQFIFIQMDKFDKDKNFPFGWTCEAIKPHKWEKS